MLSKKTNTVVKIGMLSAAAFILQLLGTYMGIKVGGFLDVEFSDLPAIIGALAIGPYAGVFIELIKNILHCTITSTGFVGELANFIINGSFVLILGFIYLKHKTRNGAFIALICGTLTLCIVGIFANLFILLPLYMGGAPFFTKLHLALCVILPFNFVKGIVLSIITILIYKKISPILK